MKDPVYIWDGVLLYAPQALRNGRHAHFPALLQVALQAPFALTLDDGRRQYCEVAVMAPNLPHATDTEGHPFLDILIDPDDPLYRYLHPLLAGQPLQRLPAAPLATLRPQLAQLGRGEVDAAAARDLLLRLLAALCPEPLPRLPWDERVLRACAWMRARIPQELPTIRQVAAAVGLSESRLMALFSDNLRLPMRQYLLWLRLRHAMSLGMEGGRLSGVAAEAGFYDQAHFTRTARRMLESLPSVLSASVSVLRGSGSGDDPPP